MYWGRVFTTFFIIMALSTNIGFIFDPSAYELILATAFNLIATTLKLGKSGILSAEILATSFVADLHLLPAIYMFFATGNVLAAQGFAMGAVVANIISIIFIVIDLVKHEDD